MIIGLDFFGFDCVVVVMWVDGNFVDLQCEFYDGVEVELVEVISEDGFNIIWYLVIYVMVQVVQQLYFEVNLGIGLFIIDGFYYDFGNIEFVIFEVFFEFEKWMKWIVKENQCFVCWVIIEEFVCEELVDQFYKLEFIGIKGKGVEGVLVEVGGGELMIYDNVCCNGEVVWKDLCCGFYVFLIKYLVNIFVLIKFLVVYWKGD